MPNNNKSYAIHIPKEKHPTSATHKEALEGLQIIAKKIDELKWAVPNDLELQRAQGSDIGAQGALGDAPKVLRFDDSITPALWKKLEGALQLSGALHRTNGDYNASVVESGGNLVIIANMQGCTKIEQSIRANLKTQLE